MSRLWKLTGGRPMHIINRFIEGTDGRDVYLCRDRLGRYWLAESGWAWFRLECVVKEQSHE